MEQLEELKSSWNDQYKLLDLYKSLAERQIELSRGIAEAESTFNSTFISEREEAYKGTDTMARARAKSLVGNNQTIWEYEFQIITNVMNLITVRISQLSQVNLESQPEPRPF